MPRRGVCDPIPQTQDTEAQRWAATRPKPHSKLRQSQVWNQRIRDLKECPLNPLRFRDYDLGQFNLHSPFLYLSKAQ